MPQRVWRLLGSLAALALLAAAWHASDLGPAREESLKDAVLDLDAGVALEARSACEARLAGFEALAAGSAPRLDAEARFVWYEAPGADGRRQIHRIERATGKAACLTCDEPGENRRPAPHPTGRAVVFDTDRFADWTRPFDRELMVLATDDGPPRASRRLTWDAARDTHALYDPSGLGVAWSRRGLAGRVVRAAIRLGHGSLSLGRRDVLARGGLGWAKPLAWSPDARALAYAAGFGAPCRLWLVDLGSGAERALPDGSAFDASVSFSADGSRMARAERTGDGTRIWLGDTDGEQGALELGELAAWGEPTGIALAPHADAFALAQRRGAEERIVWAALACAKSAAARE